MISIVLTHSVLKPQSTFASVISADQERKGKKNKTDPSPALEISRQWNDVWILLPPELISRMSRKSKWNRSSRNIISQAKVTLIGWRVESPRHRQFTELVEGQSKLYSGLLGSGRRCSLLQIFFHVTPRYSQSLSRESAKQVERSGCSLNISACQIWVFLQFKAHIRLLWNSCGT